MTKDKRPKQFLDRGWPLPLVRVDKKRVKRHNAEPKHKRR